MWIFQAITLGGLVLIAVIMLVLYVLVIFLPERRKAAKGAVKYGSERLLTSAEGDFFRVLLENRPPGVAIFAKVRLADVMTTWHLNWGRFNQVAMKHLDFVLCDGVEFKPVLVIELDDASHESEKARRSDAIKNEHLAAAGIPILRVPCRWSYSGPELRKEIKSKMLQLTS